MSWQALQKKQARQLCLKMLRNEVLWHPGADAYNREFRRLAKVALAAVRRAVKEKK